MNSYHENHSDPEIQKKYWAWRLAFDKYKQRKKLAGHPKGYQLIPNPNHQLAIDLNNAQIREHTSMMNKGKKIRRTGSQRGS